MMWQLSVIQKRWADGLCLPFGKGEERIKLVLMKHPENWVSIPSEPCARICI